MPENKFKPLSLAQLFEAPDGFLGHFGWMCGYSADAGFLNDAAERFTRQSEKQRAHAGKISLAVILDPGNPQLSCPEVPGILHLPLNKQKPFNLLHAKIGLIGFRHEAGTQWRLRLIVSTGNWTRETLEESLDLAWAIEILSHELSRRLDPETKQRCADFKASWHLFDWLRGYFDSRALTAGSEDQKTTVKDFENWMNIVKKKPALPRTRFFDSRQESLLAQLPDMINSTGIQVGRNYLAMGSGFYEAPSARRGVPRVLAQIVKKLQNTALLTRTAEVDIFVNPNACQAVAGAVSSIRRRGWHIRKAGKPEIYFGKSERALHAKFLFCANWRENSDVCNSAWLYLGSGNLTTPGLCQKMSESGGNLETGVVFAPQQLRWSCEDASEQYRVITNVLPVQWDEEYDGAAGKLRAGGEMPEREENYVAAPVPYFNWRAADAAGHGGWLTAPDPKTEPFELIDAAGVIYHSDGDNGIWWPDEQPRQVQLRWQANGQQHSAFVPVIDEFGRFAGTKLLSLDIDEAWQQLASFPMPPDDDDLPGGDGPDRTDDTPVSREHIGKASGDYPVRQMMQFIENIAAKQTAIAAADWTSWCVRLEQSLVQATGNDVVKKFQDFSLNPLSPLWDPPFRPDYAEANANPEGSRYEAVLTRIETAWNVGDLDRLGGSNETTF